MRIIFLSIFLIICSSCSLTKSILKEESSEKKKEEVLNEELYLKFNSAIFNKDKKKTLELIKKGVDINKTGAIHTIAFFGYTEFYKWLVVNVNNIDFNKKNYSSIPLMVAASKDNLIMVKDMLKRGANPHLIGSFDRNLIHIALNNNNIELFRIAASKKVNPLILGFMDKKALDYRISTKLRKELLNYIRKYKRSLNK